MQPSILLIEFWLCQLNAQINIGRRDRYDM